MLIPESSPYYTYTTCRSQAAYPRSENSSIGFDPDGAQIPLDICYRKYLPTTKPSTNARTFHLNLVFLTGASNNKAVWHYHIDKIFTNFNSKTSEIYILSAIAIDNVTHGDSASANWGKIGTKHFWQDSGQDLLKIVTETEAGIFTQTKSTTSKVYLNVLIGHSLGGFAAMYASMVNPELFDSCITFNPMCYHNPAHHDLWESNIRNWFRRGLIKTKFSVKGISDWKSHILNHWREKSFFMKYHPIVLHNMLEDEIPDHVKQLDHVDEVELKSSSYNQLLTYLGYNQSVPSFLPLLSHVKVPVYHVFSEHDTARQESLPAVRGKLPMCHPVDLPNTYHLVNGEEPDLVVAVIQLILQQRCASQLKKKYPKDRKPLRTETVLETNPAVGRVSKL